LEIHTEYLQECVRIHDPQLEKMTNPSPTSPSFARDQTNLDGFCAMLMTRETVSGGFEDK
jgi:hypothetical protein